MIGDILGAPLGVFVGVTILLFGGAAFLTGQALAETWRPAWHILPYVLLMAAADRFLSFALFRVPPLSASGYIAAALVLGLAMLGGYKLTRAHRMVTQYPWLYERAGPFGWREKGPGN